MSNAAATMGPTTPTSENSPRIASEPKIATAASTAIHALIFAIPIPSARAPQLRYSPHRRALNPNAFSQPIGDPQRAR
jgi:hypothetical protein